MKKVHVIDVCAVFFRFYFSPSPEYLNDDGWDVSSLLSMTRWLCKKQFLEAPMVVLAFDESLGSGFRHKIDENYKANRALPTPDIIYQLSLLKTIGEYLGFVVLASEEFEADDLIASTLHLIPGRSCIVYSRDKDLKQVITNSATLLDFVTDVSWTPESLLDDMGLKASQIPLYLALMGDSSDNIVGVKGVGDKTARALLQEGQHWPELLQSIYDNDPLNIRGEVRVKKNILACIDLIEKNLSLTKLRIDAPTSLISQRLDDDSWQVLNALLAALNVQKPLKKSLGLVSGYVL